MSAVVTKPTLYTFNFEGCRLNALGTSTNYTCTIRADTYEEAFKKLNERYQDISIIWWSNR